MECSVFIPSIQVSQPEIKAYIIRLKPIEVSSKNIYSLATNMCTDNKAR